MSLCEVARLSGDVATLDPNCGEILFELRSFQGHFVASLEARTSPRASRIVSELDES